MPVSPITHILASWSLAEGIALDDRDRALITWCGVLPDADGVGIAADLVNRLLGRSETAWYTGFHHQFLHGLIGAVLLAVLAAGFAKRRLRVLFWGFVIVHVHLMCDLLGSRGSEPTDIWPIHYLAPVSAKLTLYWHHQWALNGWQNVLTTALLIAFAVQRAITAGRSPVSLFSQKAHLAVTGALRSRWQQLKERGRQGK
jgi:LexA-binding, inner membrane-associated putative hydrolase